MLAAIFFLLIATSMYQKADSQVCKKFPKVSNRHPSCFKRPTCVRDGECTAKEKCCENECGVLECQKISFEWSALEKCPSTTNGISKEDCPKIKTKFCYLNNCNRCCTHFSSCNPQPLILTDVAKCKKQICSTHRCNHQGEQCFIDKDSLKPYCKCSDSCPLEVSTICVESIDRRKKTFINRCMMEREACDRKITYKVLYERKCDPDPKAVKPYMKPYTKQNTEQYVPGSLVMVTCYADTRGRNLRWLQKRDDGTEILISQPENEGELQKVTKDGITKTVLQLMIRQLGHGGYGEYVCRQSFKGDDHQTIFRILQPNNSIFDKGSCYVASSRGVDPEKGFATCRGNFTNFYYNDKEKECQKFFYNGCGGNENNFQTKKDCELRCKGLSYKSPKKQPIHYGNQCGNEVCQYFSECKQSTFTNQKKCVCNDVCSLFPNPVCGSDGRSYMSLCILKSIACRYRKPIYAIHRGLCGSSSLKTTPKPKIKSLCDIVRCPPYATCHIDKTTNAPQCICSRRCSLKYDVICATNMKEYFNQCFMELDSCHSNMKFEVFKKGLCPFKKT
eukprot:TCONS_00058019-protein